MQKEQNPLSNKIKRFRKGKIQAKNFKVNEKFQPKNREERVFSLLTKPNLVFLTDMLPETEENEEGCYSRMRAKTIQIN